MISWRNASSPIYNPPNASSKYLSFCLDRFSYSIRSTLKRIKEQYISVGRMVIHLARAGYKTHSDGSCEYRLLSRSGHPDSPALQEPSRSPYNCVQ